ncbi:MAG: hypothetical protein M0R51_14385 [Clostridia bacterium]|jgi:hypothetical protein|nr:hypothetical protein [Clostridia bacterium]
MVYEVKKEMNGNGLTITYNGELVATFSLNECITKENVFYHTVTVYADGRTTEEVITRIVHKAGNSSTYGED